MSRILYLKEMVARTFRTLETRPNMQVGAVGMARLDQAYADWTGREPGPSGNPYTGRPTTHSGPRRWCPDAGDVAAGFDAVQYFPSYEIITGGFNRGAYFEDDLRSVRPTGISHVMQVFRQRLVASTQTDANEDDPVAAAQAQLEKKQAEQKQAELTDQMVQEMYLICDEELLVR